MSTTANKQFIKNLKVKKWGLTVWSTQRISYSTQISCCSTRWTKVHGGYVGAQNSEITYINICKQLDEGIKQGFTETKWLGGSENLQKIKKGLQLSSYTPVNWKSEHQQFLEHFINILPGPPESIQSLKNLSFFIWLLLTGKWVIGYGSLTVTPAEQSYHLHSKKMEFSALK